MNPPVERQQGASFDSHRVPQSLLTMRQPRGESMGLAYRLGHGGPRSIRSESSQASCLQCCSAVAWCRGRRGGRRHEQGPLSTHTISLYPKEGDR
jgi:hypothetical protein